MRRVQEVAAAADAQGAQDKVILDRSRAKGSLVENACILYQTQHVAFSPCQGERMHAKTCCVFVVSRVENACQTCCVFVCP